jgi:propanediol dehydratase small subunit
MTDESLILDVHNAMRSMRRSRETLKDGADDGQAG